MGLFVGRVKDYEGVTKHGFQCRNSVTHQGLAHIAQTAWSDAAGISANNIPFWLGGSWMGLVDATSFGGFSATDRGPVADRNWTELTSYSLPNVAGNTARRARAVGGTGSPFERRNANAAVMEIYEFPTTWDNGLWNPTDPASIFVNAFSFAASCAIAGFFLTNVESKGITLADTMTLGARWPVPGVVYATGAQAVTFAASDTLELVYITSWKAGTKTY